MSNDFDTIRRQIGGKIADFFSIFYKSTDVSVECDKMMGITHGLNEIPWCFPRQKVYEIEF